MHLKLDHFNLLLSGKATAEERGPLTDHILSCAACATHFRMLHDLDQKLNKPAFPLRYLVGVAAVMLMSLVPYFSRKHAETPTLAANDDIPVERSLAVIDKVVEVNYKHALTNWGNRSDTRELVRLRNKM